MPEVFKMPVPPVDEQPTTEGQLIGDGVQGVAKTNIPITLEQSRAWARKGREGVERSDLPPALKEQVIDSLDAPQFGPYHTEGITQASHVGLMQEKSAQIKDGKFDFSSLGLSPELTALVSELVTKSVRTHAELMDNYAETHDVEKRNCLSLSFTDGRPDTTWSMAEWKALCEQFRQAPSQPLSEIIEANTEAIRQKLRDLGIEKIGYFQSRDITKEEHTRQHGLEGYNLIMKLAEEDAAVKEFAQKNTLLLAGIANHEMHFQVFNRSKRAQQFIENLVHNEILGRDINDDERAFIVTACLVDIVSSLGEEGKSFDQSFANMMEAMQSYQEIQVYKEEREQAKDPLLENEYGNLLNQQGLKETREWINRLRIKSSGLSAEQQATILETLTQKGIATPENTDSIRAALGSGKDYLKELGIRKLGQVSAEVRNILGLNVKKK